MLVLNMNMELLHLHKPTRRVNSPFTTTITCSRRQARLSSTLDCFRSRDSTTRKLSRLVVTREVPRKRGSHRRIISCSGLLLNLTAGVSKTYSAQYTRKTKWAHANFNKGKVP